MKRIAIKAGLWAACWTLSALAAHADSITLRASARLQADQPVTLANVAALEGEAAEGLAGLTLRESAADSGGAIGPITLEEVRAALESAGVNWGRLALSGAACAVRVVAPAAAPPLPIIGPAADPQVRSETGGVAVAGSGTIRARVTALLARVLDVDLADLRVGFEPRDEDLLSLSLTGRRVEAQPAAAAGGSERMPFTIWIYEGDRIAQRRTILVESRIRARVLVLAEEADRDKPIRASKVRSEERWLAPGGSPLVESLAGLNGAVARSRLAAGTVLRQAHLEMPIIVRKNQLVTVHCVGQAIVLKAQARAQADGGEGDVIPFRLEGAERGFLARVDGPGRAVVVLAGAAREQVHSEGASP